MSEWQVNGRHRLPATRARKRARAGKESKQLDERASERSLE